MKRHIYKFVNPNTNQQISFDSVNYVIKEIDFGSIEASLNSYAGAGQYGNTITSRTLGTREIEIKGYLLADNESIMQQQKHRLQSVTTPLNDFQIVIDETFMLTVTAQSTIEFSSLFYENNEQLCYFELEAFAANPFFELLENEDAEIASWIKDFHFPVKFEPGKRFTFGHRNPLKVTKVNNKGEIDSGIQIKLKAMNGDVVNPYITNIDTGETIKLNTKIPNGDEIFINTEYGKKEIRNLTTEENWLQYLDLSSEFMTVPIGISSFTYGFDEGSTGNIKCSIQYMPKFLAV